VSSPPWLVTISASFRAHRQGRQGWHLQVHRDRLRITSRELPPRPGEDATSTRARSLTLKAPPGPATITAALAEACDVFDRVMAGTWTWPGPDDARPEGTTDPASPASLERLISSLRDQLVGERMTEGTWQRTWQPYLSALVAAAAEAPGEPGHAGPPAAPLATRHPRPADGARPLPCPLAPCRLALARSRGRHAGQRQGRR